MKISGPHLVKKFPRILGNQTFHCRFHNSPSRFPILAQINPIHTPVQLLEDPFEYYHPTCALLSQVVSCFFTNTFNARLYIVVGKENIGAMESPPAPTVFMPFLQRNLPRSIYYFKALRYRTVQIFSVTLHAFQILFELIKKRPGIL